MPVDEFHRQVAAIALSVAAQHGFALGGRTRGAEREAGQ